MNKKDRRSLILEMAINWYNEGRATSREMLMHDPELREDNFSTVDREIRYMIDQKLLKRVPARRGYFLPFNATERNKGLKSFMKPQCKECGHLLMEGSL